jgi:hypothetical protein
MSSNQLNNEQPILSNFNFDLDLIRTWKNLLKAHILSGRMLTPMCQ